MPCDPAAPLKLKELGIVKNIRKRALDIDEFGDVNRDYPEIEEFWSFLTRVNRTDIRVRTALKILLTLGIRSQELRLARFSDLDLDKRILNVPVESQKGTLERASNAITFRVPLTDFAIQLIESLRPVTGSGEFIIGDPKRGIPMDQSTLPEAMKRFFNGDGKRSWLPKTRPHDLRRTMENHLDDLGVPPHVASKALNHAAEQLKQHYSSVDLLDQRREAMEQWNVRLQNIVAPRPNLAVVRLAG